MSMYAQGEVNQTQIATNTGWGRFGDWADTLNAQAYPVIVHLWEHGYTEELSELQQQLVDAQSADPPTSGVAETIGAILEFLKKEQVIIIITNGLTNSDDNDDDL